jgi:hypothetical protein
MLAHNVTTAISPQPTTTKYISSNHALPYTAATTHFLDTSVKRHCTYAEKNTSGPTVRIASGHTIVAQKWAKIPLAKELSATAKEGHIFPDLQSGSLVSIGQLCVDNCITLFAKSEMAVVKDGAVIIRGPCDTANGLWSSIPLNPSPSPQPYAQPSTKPRTHSANGVIQTSKTQSRPRLLPPPWLRFQPSPFDLPPAEPSRAATSTTGLASPHN